MSYVGKILVVVQVILSLLFMAFAGAVFAIHSNWKDKYNEAQVSLEANQQRLGAVQEELTVVKRESETRLAEETAAKNAAQARNAGLVLELAALREQNAALDQQRATQTGLAEAKSGEARFRQEEAEQQRIENQKLQARVDEQSEDLRQTRDQLFAFEQQLRDLNRIYERHLEELAYLRRVVANQGIETDPEVVAKQQAPPPPVEGLVLEIRKNRANRVNFVEMSIGSDDGLKTGDELDVVRVINEGDADWLGRVRVVDLGPNWAVGEVVLPAKNGIIQEGDNVTTRL